MNIVGLMRALRRATMLPALAFCVATVMPTVSQAQIVEWRGRAFLYNFTDACAVMGYPVGGRMRVYARLRPSGIGDNGPATRLSFFDRDYVSSFVLENGRFTTSLRSVRAGGLDTDYYPWPGPTQVRVSSQTPGNGSLRANTQHIYMVGEILGIEAVADCSYSFYAAMLSR